MNENGLILKDKIINRISGPVSMYYLTPSLRELHNYKEENIDLSQLTPLDSSNINYRPTKS